MRQWFRWSKPTRVVFHIGLPKCGSTTIQAHFADYDTAYRAQGLVYPVKARSPDGYRSHVPLLHMPPADLRSRIRAIAEEAQGARVILLSCEAFADYLPRGNSAEVGAALAEEFGADNVTILAYFRNPAPFMASAYAQFVVGGLLDVPKGPFFSEGPSGLAAFVHAASERKGFAPYDYLGWVQAIQAAFPGLDLNLRSMEAADIGDNLIDDLGRVLKVRRLGQGTQILNTRHTASSILALQHAQTVLPQSVFQRQRPKMRHFRLSTAPDWTEADARHRDLVPNADLTSRIAATMQDSRPVLARMFSTKVRGLVTIASPGSLSDRPLSKAEQDEVVRAFTQHS